MNKIAENNIEKNVAITTASMKFEGFNLTKDEIDLMRKVGRGETTVKREIRRLLAELTVK